MVRKIDEKGRNRKEGTAKEWKKEKARDRKEEIDRMKDGKGKRKGDREIKRKKKERERERRKRGRRRKRQIDKAKSLIC